MATIERPLRKDAERNRRRILEAAADLFTRRGLGVTLNDIAHHADVGVGTVYRRFPSKELLIDALFEDRFSDLIALAEEGLADPDPWGGFVGFLERALELQARDKALKQLMLGTPEGCARIDSARERIVPLVEALVARAREAGELAPDIEAEDFPFIQWMLGAVVDYGGDVKPDLWRRYLELLLRAMRTDPTKAEPLSVDAPTRDELDEIMDTAHGSPRRAAARRD
jgi:AcrR family transcriptional regulator